MRHGGFGGACRSPPRGPPNRPRPPSHPAARVRAHVLHALDRHALDGSGHDGSSFSVARLLIGWCKRAAHWSEETSDELLGSIGLVARLRTRMRVGRGAVVASEDELFDR